jgi:glycosyltransferase involved in cell wall biosynthesis
MSQSIKHIALLSYFSPGRISGPSNSLTGLASNYPNNDCKFHVYTTSKNISENFIINDVEIQSFNSFLDDLHKFDLVVLAGLYDLNIYKASKYCKKAGIKYIVSPRSNLMLESLKKSYFKKKLAYFSYVGSLLRGAYALHYLSNEERVNSKKTKSEFIIAPNGFHPPKSDLNLYNKSNLIVFIGRLDIHHKGLDLLCESIRKLKTLLEMGGWEVRIYGPDSVKDLNILVNLITKLELSDLIKVNGPVVGSEKEKILGQSKVFVHPSRYEGQPQAVLEAMAYGAIPITTKGANMSEDLAGFVRSVNFDVDDFSDALSLAMKSYNEEIAEKLKNYANDNFNWRECAKLFIKECKRIGAI